MKRYHILVSGYVQGVGFRYYTKKTANNLGIKGWVRNLTDGRVEIMAEGEGVDKFVEYVRRGPTSARVDDIQIDDMEADNERYDSFEIRYTGNY